MTPELIIVGADKGGVGKTTITRLLVDYFRERNIEPNLFDTEGALTRFFPDAHKVDIETVEGKMKIFDSVPSHDVTVVDMRAAVLSKTLADMRNAGLLDPSDRGDMRLVVLHVLGSSVQSLNEVIDTNAQLAEGGEHVLIENRANDGNFFHWDMKSRDAFFKTAQPKAHFDVPHLDARVIEDIDASAQTFFDYIKNIGGKNSDYLARTARYWRKQVYEKFDTLKLITDDKPQAKAYYQTR